MTKFARAAALWLLRHSGVGVGSARQPGGGTALCAGDRQRRIQAAKLATPANDAGLVADALQAAGFTVTGARNLDQATLRESFREFIDQVVGRRAGRRRAGLSRRLSACNSTARIISFRSMPTSSATSTFRCRRYGFRISRSRWRRCRAASRSSSSTPRGRIRSAAAVSRWPAAWRWSIRAQHGDRVQRRAGHGRARRARSLRRLRDRR